MCHVQEISRTLGVLEPHWCCTFCQVMLDTKPDNDPYISALGLLSGLERMSVPASMSLQFVCSIFMIGAKNNPQLVKCDT